MTDEREPGYELVMPFITVQSVGGPHEDVAYSAGYEMGLLDARLQHGARAEISRDLARVNVGQADLIAMRHGYVLTVRRYEEYPEWAGATFTPNEYLDREDET